MGHGKGHYLHPAPWYYFKGTSERLHKECEVERHKLIPTTYNSINKIMEFHIKRIKIPHQKDTTQEQKYF